MNVVLFDPAVEREQLLPFTFTRPVSEIRCGIFTIAEKWKQRLGVNVSYLAHDYLSKKYPANLTNDNLIIDGSVFPDNDLVETLKRLKLGEALIENERLIAARCDAKTARDVQ